MLVPILVAIGVALILGLVTAMIFWKVNSKINVVQRNLNKLENRLSAAGADWLADILADGVIGDTSSLYHKLSSFVESDDITLFFLDNIGMGVTEYTIRETAQYYPEKFDKIVRLVEVASKITP